MTLFRTHQLLIREASAVSQPGDITGVSERAMGDCKIEILNQARWEGD